MVSRIMVAVIHFKHGGKFNNDSHVCWVYHVYMKQMVGPRHQNTLHRICKGSILGSLAKTTTQKTPKKPTSLNLSKFLKFIAVIHAYTKIRELNFLWAFWHSVQMYLFICRFYLPIELILHLFHTVNDLHLWNMHMYADDGKRGGHTNNVANTSLCSVVILDIPVKIFLNSNLVKCPWSINYFPVVQSS